MPNKQFRNIYLNSMQEFRESLWITGCPTFLVGLNTREVSDTGKNTS